MLGTQDLRPKKDVQQEEALQTLRTLETRSKVKERLVKATAEVMTLAEEVPNQASILPTSFILYHRGGSPKRWIFGIFIDAV